MEDADLLNKSENILHFRTLPWPQWTLAFLFSMGAGLLISVLWERILVIKTWMEVLCTGFLLFMSVLFLSTGKIKTIIIDRAAK